MASPIGSSDSQSIENQEDTISEDLLSQDESISQVWDDSMSNASSVSSRSSIDAVRDFFVSSSHPSKLKKYQHIIGEYIKHLGGRDKVSESLRTLEGFEQYNPMVEHVTQAYRILAGEGNWSHKNERERYRAFVIELRAAIETRQYQKFRHYPEETTPRQRVCVNFIKDLVAVRWFESDMYDHLRKATETFLEHSDSSSDEDSIGDLSEEDFPKTFLEMNERIKGASPEVRKRKVALWKQQFQGATGMKDFSGTENIPFIRCRYVYEDDEGKRKTIHYMRHSRPTVGGNVLQFLGGVVTRLCCRVLGIRSSKALDGESIASDYEEAICIAKERGEAIFYVVHQRRTPGVVENEADSTKLIEQLDRKHPNFHTLIQGVEGPLFEQGEGYDFHPSMRVLKLALLDSFRPDPTSPNRLPNAVSRNEAYHADLGRMFDEVKKIFFPEVDDKTPLSKEDWQKMILYFYVFQKDDLKFRLSNDQYSVKYYTTPCKDFLDRGGNMAMVEDFVHYHMADQSPSTEDLEHTLYTTLGAPILVKKKQVIEHRIERGLDMVSDLSQMNAKQAEALQAHRFHGSHLVEVAYSH